MNPDGGAPSAGGFDLTPDVVLQIANDLNLTSDELDRGGFARLHVAESVFGGSTQGRTLGLEHGLAHRVAADTVQGVVSDLRAFSDGIRGAVHLATRADEQSAVDLKKLAGAGPLQFQADRRNEESRLQNLPPAGSAGAPAQPGTQPTDGGADR